MDYSDLDGRMHGDGVFTAVAAAAARIDKSQECSSGSSDYDQLLLDARLRAATSSTNQRESKQSHSDAQETEASC